MIYLRELTEEDLPRISLWRQDRDLADKLGDTFRYTNWETERAWFHTYMACRDTNIRLAVCLKQTHVHVGNAYILNIDWTARCGEFHLFIGNTDARGKGYGRQAVRLVLEHAFFDRNLHRISLRVLTNNHPAIALYEKSGFQREGILRQAAFKNGEYADLIAMAILHEEFVKV